MKGLWLEQDSLTLKTDLPSPAAGEGELVLDVELAGICGTDLELLAGYAGFSGVPGHEFVGVVAPGQGAWSGTRVVTDINVSCGQCAECSRRLGKHCLNRSVIGIREHGGAFAEQVVAPIRNCLPVPPQFTAEQAALIEPLAAALEILESVDISEGDRVLVVGAGRLAQLIAQVLANTPADLEVLVRSDQRRATLDPVGVTCVDDANGKYDVVVEASGHPDGFAKALEATRPRGKLVLKSTYAGLLSLDVSRIVVDEIRVIGSRCGPTALAIDWMREGRVRIDHLRFEHFSLDAFESAFASARDSNIYKVFLDPSG